MSAGPLSMDLRFAPLPTKYLLGRLFIRIQRRGKISLLLFDVIK